MLEEKIREIMESKGLSPENIYKELDINRVNFYKAIKSSNLNNKSLQKILKLLNVSIEINLKDNEASK